MRTRRSIPAAAVAALTLLSVLTSAVSAAPVERTRSTISCLGASVTLVFHPGWGGSVLWDISTEEEPNKPSYIMKRIDGETFVNGVSQGTFSVSLGQMTGFGEPLQCTWEVHKPGFDAYGTSELVEL